jgi:hypothetical protein
MTGETNEWDSWNHSGASPRTARATTARGRSHDNAQDQGDDSGTTKPAMVASGTSAHQVLVGDRAPRVHDPHVLPIHPVEIGCSALRGYLNC